MVGNADSENRLLTEEKALVAEEAMDDRERDAFGTLG